MRNRNPSATPIVDPSLEAIRQRFEEWRQFRKPSSPIPEALWAEAVELARVHGVNPIAQRLHLSYSSLKHRLDAALQKGSAVPQAKPAFVELISPVAADMTECTVELERPGEATMRIHLKSVRLPDLEALTRLFWSAKA